jgi:hypothetical protein
VLVFDRPATIRRPVSSLLLLACAALTAAAASAQDLPTQTISDAGTIDRVVIYPTSAAVTRVIHKDLTQGLWTIRVTNLPEGVVGAQLQAKVRSGDAPGPSTPPRSLDTAPAAPHTRPWVGPSGAERTSC